MSKFNLVISFFVLVFLLMSSPSYSQGDHDTLQYKLGFDFTGRKISGTFDQLVAGGNFKMDLLYKNLHLVSHSNYRFNKTNSRLIEDNWYELMTLKYYFNGNRKLFPGVFYHFDNNLMYRVNSRHQYGLGLGSELEKNGHTLSLMAAFANEYSSYNGSEFANSDRDFSVRKNGLFLFKLNNGFAVANKKIHFSYQLFYFQSLKEKADYDLWLTPRISFKVIKGLSVYVVYDYRLENVYLETLSDYNDILLFGINWKLKS